MADVLDRLLEHWRHRQEKPAASTATLDEIENWERKYGVRLPDDLREYVLRVNGIHCGEELEFDNNLNTLLPLSAMKPECEWWSGQTSSNRFVIADHCISCFWWTVDLNAEPRPETAVFLSGASDGKPRLVASSLDEFLEMYITDAAALYGG
jgi:hypothetical protein